jgi:hypothetical protein
MAERAADKALASKAPLQDTALQLHAFMQFHVIDGFSALHPHNNHITTHNDKDCMPFLPG